MSTVLGQVRGRVPRFAEAAVERARLSVVPRTSARTPRVPFVALVCLLLLGGVAGLLYFNTSMQQASFTATSLQERATALGAQEQSLQMDLETLRDPQKLAVRAQQLGMVAPSSPAFLRLSDGKVLGTPVPAQRSDALRIVPLPTKKPKNLRPDPVILPAPRVSGRSARHSANAAEVRAAGSAVASGAATAPEAASTGTKEAHQHSQRQHAHQGSQR